MIEYPKMLYGPPPLGGEVIVQDKEEEEKYMDIGYAYTPKGNKDKVDTEYVMPASPGKEILCFPRMMYHFIHPPKIVQNEAEQDLLENEGWRTSPQMFSEEKAIEQQIKQKEFELETLKENLKKIREERAAQGPVENILSVEIPTTHLKVPDYPEKPVEPVVEKSESVAAPVPKKPGALPFLCLICGAPFATELAEQEHEKTCIKSRKNIAGGDKK